MPRSTSAQIIHPSFFFLSFFLSFFLYFFLSFFLSFSPITLFLSPICFIILPLSIYLFLPLLLSLSLSHLFIYIRISFFIYLLIFYLSKFSVRSFLLLVVFFPPCLPNLVASLRTGSTSLHALYLSNQAIR